MKRIIAVIAALCLCGILLGGCGMFERLREVKQQNEQQAEPQLLSAEAEQQPGQQPEQDAAEGEQPPAQSDIDPAAAREVILYFASADGTALEAEIRSIAKQEGVARATLDQLIAGPQRQELSPTLPAGTIIEGVNIADGLCTVDFSLPEQAQLADQDELQLAMYSVVNTLCQFDTVDRVQILLNGQSVASINGAEALSFVQ
ncbi:MAG: GerMN domain-containing protein [Bacillota bacterium]|nr:GerMN domain-containing protein [Bacillota bacterium]